MSVYFFWGLNPDNYWCCFSMQAFTISKTIIKEKSWKAPQQIYDLLLEAVKGKVYFLATRLNPSTFHALSASSSHSMRMCIFCHKPPYMLCLLACRSQGQGASIPQDSIHPQFHALRRNETRRRREKKRRFKEAGCLQYRIRQLWDDRETSFLPLR